MMLDIPKAHENVEYLTFSKFVGVLVIITYVVN